jgi:two-component system sensor histidine kinase BaeS
MLLRLGCGLIFLVVLVAIAFNVVVWIFATVTGLFGSPTLPVGALVGILLGTALAGYIAFRWLRRMTVPLEEMADAAERIEQGDYSARVVVSGPGRMRSLASAFNDMSARLEAVDQGRRAFLADAAHELRTPLSIIAGQIEAIEDGLYPADAEHLEPVREQLRTLEKLIDDMRTVALAESGALTLNLQPIDIGASIDHVVAAFQPEASAAGVTITADYPPGLPKAKADELRVGQVLTNLISNALRHTPKGGHVTVTAASTASSVEVRVRDDGEGISSDLLPRVFDRFARETSSAGSGLGLAICRDLVEAQHGQIAIENVEPHGIVVSFTLPTAL